MKLVAEVNGWSYQEAARRIDEFIGNEPRKPNRGPADVTDIDINDPGDSPADQVDHDHMPDIPDDPALTTEATAMRDYLEMPTAHTYRAFDAAIIEREDAAFADYVLARTYGG